MPLVLPLSPILPRPPFHPRPGETKPNIYQDTVLQLSTVCWCKHQLTSSLHH